MSEVEGMSFESWGSSEQAQEVSEEQQQKISENQKKAKQVKAKIQKQQKQNKKTADMLTILFKAIDDEETFLFMYSFIDEYNIEVSEMFKSLLPFLVDYLNPELLKELWLEKENYTIKNNLKDYFEYFKPFMKESSFKNVEKERLVEYLRKIIYYFDLGEIKTIRNQEESIQEYDDKIKNYLFEELKDI